MSGVENARPENAGRENQDRKMEDQRPEAAETFACHCNDCTNLLQTSRDVGGGMQQRQTQHARCSE